MSVNLYNRAIVRYLRTVVPRQGVNDKLFVLDEDAVTLVDIAIDPGYQSCSGCNPDDYGSFDSPASAQICIHYTEDGHGKYVEVSADVPLGDLVAGAVTLL